MNTQTYLPPIAEIHKLPGLFRLIEQGEIRVPEFQRRFIWCNRQILDLLESLYRGIPIGTLLLWKVDDQSVGVEFATVFPFPNVPLKRPFRLILDGLQRLYT